MAVLPILPAGNPLVRKKSKRVKHIDSSIHKLLDDMVETMRDAVGVGLAAPQVGVLLRVIVMQLPEEDLIELINPQIVKASGEQEVEEGCLCMPGYLGKIKRSQVVRAKGFNREGKLVRIKGEGLLAEALEHEIDHLNGVLYLDHLESLDLLRKVERPDPVEEIIQAEP